MCIYYLSGYIYSFIRVHQICYFPSWVVNNLNWGGVVSPSSSGLCGYEECSFGLECRFGTHGVLLLLDLLSNSLGVTTLSSMCGNYLR
jgi:hypothetical protein